jgi:ATP-binding cassette subfamily B protein
MDRYLSYVRQYRWSTFALIMVVAIGSLSRNVPPLYYKKFFDLLASATAGDKEFVAVGLVGILGILALIEGINWTAWRLASLLNTYVETRISSAASQDCFETLHRHSFSFFNNNFVGSLTKKAYRFVGGMSMVLDQVVWTLLPLVLNVGMITVVLYGRSPILAAIIAVWIVIFL